MLGRFPPPKLVHQDGRDHQPLQKWRHTDSENQWHGGGVGPPLCNPGIEPLAPDRIREAGSDEDPPCRPAFLGWPGTCPENERGDPIRGEQNHHVSGSAMEACPDKIGGSPIMIGIEWRLQKLPYAIEQDPRPDQLHLRYLHDSHG